MDDGERWVVVVSPRGDVVRLGHEWDHVEAASLFGCVLTGTITEMDKDVVVRGSHVALCWRERYREEW